MPNVEFVFGLTGSTASVVIAYILPSLMFLSLSGRPALLSQLDPDDVRTGQPHPAAGCFPRAHERSPSDSTLIPT